MEDKNSIKFKSQIYAAARAQCNTLFQLFLLLQFRAPLNETFSSLFCQSVNTNSKNICHFTLY